MKLTIIKNLTEEQIDILCGHVTIISDYRHVIIPTDQMEDAGMCLGNGEGLVFVEIDTDETPETL